ncbi:MAG: hypothetical protein ACOCYB_02295 [Alkalispirochaeta sp.]
MVILSSRISTIDDLDEFIRAADGVWDELGHDSTMPIVLHPVGLPAFVSPDRPIADGIARLREVAGRTAVQFWNGGYAGAPGTHLTAEEISWDLTWGRTNPWDTGFARCVAVSTTTDFPVLLTEVQAHQLTQNREPHHGMLCLGYAGYTGAPPPSGPHRLWFHGGGRWKWLRSHVVPLTRPSPEPSDAPVDCIHVVIPAGSRGGGELIRREIRELPFSGGAIDSVLKDASSPPRGTFFRSGLEDGGSWLRPSAAAAVADARRSPSVPRDKTAAVLRAAAECSPPRQRVSPGERKGDVSTHDPFRNRELQGGITGSLRLDTDTVGVTFLAGRVAGFTLGDAALTPAVRAHGFRQTTQTTHYLETVSAAWFTGLRVRGVHEVAEIQDTVRMGITTFAMERLPGLVMNIATHRLSAAIGEEPRRRGLLEVPMMDRSDASAPRTGAILTSSGHIREISLIPDLEQPIADASSPIEWSVGAVGLRIDLLEASLWIIAAHPGVVLPISFSLGARAIPGGFRVSWYPIGFERAPTSLDPRCNRWTVSYRILAVERHSVFPVSPRVEPDLSEEIDGFTCQEGAPTRSVPTT